MKGCDTCGNRTENSGCDDPWRNLIIYRPISESEKKCIKDFGCYGYCTEWPDKYD